MSMVKRGKRRVSGGGHIHYARYIWDILSQQSCTITAQDLQHNRVHLAPIDIPFDCTIDRLIFMSGFTQNNNFNMGIYEDNGYTPQGGNLLICLGTTAYPAGASRKVETATNYMLNRGLYWIGWIKDSTNADVWTNGETTTITSGTLTDYYYDSSGTQFTDPCPTVTSQTLNPVMGVRILT